MFKIKTGYCLELLMHKTMNSLESTKSKITKDKKGENVSHLEITEVLLIHLILLTTIINKIKETYIHLFLINHLINY